MGLNTRHAHVIDGLVPYVVVTPANREYLDLAPFGVEIRPENALNPMRVSSQVFLAMLQELDALTFGPEGMPMPRWVFYDCSEMSGAIFGFGRPAKELDAETRKTYGVPVDYVGLVPFSMYIAIPMADRGSWFGHNLCSISPTLPHLGLRGLGSVTKSLALKTFRTQRFYGATQWDSKALYIHSKFGMLGLMTAYTPAHSDPLTLTYFFDVTDDCLRAAAGDEGITMERPDPEEWVTCTNVARLLELQDAIEAGAKYVVPIAPRMDDDGVLLVPVTRIG